MTGAGAPGRNFLPGSAVSCLVSLGQCHADQSYVHRCTDCTTPLLVSLKFRAFFWSPYIGH